MTGSLKPQDMRTAAAVLDADEWDSYVTGWLAAAEARGYRKAIDRLRDNATYADWRDRTAAGYVTPQHRLRLADYLEALNDWLNPHDLTQHGCPTCGGPANGTVTPGRETDHGVEAATGFSRVSPCGCPLLAPWVMTPPVDAGLVSR
jgi:hypothetical protein